MYGPGHQVRHMYVRQSAYAFMYAGGPDTSTYLYVSYTLIRI